MVAIKKIFYFLLVFFWISNLSYAQVSGSIDYNQTLKRYEYFDGTAWKPFLLTITLLPCDREANMEYDSVLKSYRYCNGTNWTHIIGIPTLSACTQDGAKEYTGTHYRYCNGLLWVIMSS